MKTYLYPQNLKASANLWLWSLRDFTILAVATLISVLIFVNTLFYIPIVVVLIYAFMTIRLEDITVMDFIRYAVKFFITTQQNFEWADKVRVQSAHWIKIPALNYGGESAE
jgi:hypothetical protein